MAKLDIHNLTIKYNEVVAVNQLELSVAEGEFVTLLGPSGCGKTTTLRCIAGLEPRAAGEIRIGDEVVSGPDREVAPEARNVNMVFQTYAVWPHMTVFKNVSYGLRVRKMSKREVQRRTNEALQLVGLQDFADRYGTELSGGQQQRVALARAIVTEPRLLLFDEPLSNLDASLREQMRLELRDLHQRIGKTAVYVTHDQVEAMVMSDTVVLMNDGQIVQSGPPQELYERPCTRFAAEFLGMANIWDATISHHGADGSAVTTIDGDEHTLQLPPATQQPPAGMRGAVGIRAECIELTAPTTTNRLRQNMWTGTIERIVYLGGCLQYRIRVGSRVLRCETPTRVQFRIGDDVLVHLRADDLVWLADNDSPTHPDTIVHTAVATA